MYLKESSRYMLSANNIEGVIDYLNHMAQVNKRDIKVSYLYYQDVDGKKEQKRNKSMAAKLFGRKNIVLSMSLIICWFTQAFGSGIYLWIPLIMLNHGFSKNQVYVFMMVCQTMPLFSIFFASTIIDSFGRRILLFWSSLLAGVSFLIYLAFPEGASIPLFVFYISFSIFYASVKV